VNSKAVDVLPKLKEKETVIDENDGDGFFCGLCVATRKKKTVKANKFEPDYIKTD